MSVSIDVGGQPVDVLPTLARPDVVRCFPESDPQLVGGFEGVVPISSMSGEVCLTVVLHFSGRAECVAAVAIAVAPAQIGYRGRRSPILLTSAGRTGSTLAMALLARHPSILCAGPFPFEQKCALYWVQAALVLSSPADRGRSLLSDEFEANRFSLGINPYLSILPKLAPASTRWAAEQLPGLVFDRFLDIIDSYYQAVAVDCGKLESTHFVEKAFHRFLPPIVRELYADSKEVFLVRDPRDVYVSTCAFHRKWGYKMYDDSDRFASERDHIQYLGDRLNQIIADWKSRQDKSLLIRYEDLVADPASITTAIFEYLGLDSGPNVVAAAVNGAFAESDEVRAHRTSASPAESVARWRRELPAPLAEACNATFRPFLELFGY